MAKPNVVQWDCWDERLPAKDELIVREPPSQAFLESIKEIQLHPIGVTCDAAEKYALIFGRKRLLAIRKLQADAEHTGRIDVQIFKDLSAEEVARFSLEENYHRSNNDLQAFLSIKQLMAQGMTYREIADGIGMSTATIKKIEREWDTTPEWAVMGAMSGEMAMSTAKAVGRAPKHIQKTLHHDYKLNNRLTAQQVQSAMYVQHTKAQADLQGSLDKSSPAVGLRQVFTREELEGIRDLLHMGEVTNAKAEVARLLGASG